MNRGSTIAARSNKPIGESVHYKNAAAKARIERGDYVGRPDEAMKQLSTVPTFAGMTRKEYNYRTKSKYNPVRLAQQRRIKAELEATEVKLPGLGG